MTATFIDGSKPEFADPGSRVAGGVFEELEIIFRSWTEAMVLVDAFQVPGTDYTFDECVAGRNLSLVDCVSAKQLALVCFLSACTAAEDDGVKRG